MKALQIKQYGGMDVMYLNPNASKSAPGQGQVLVEAHAVSINPIDWKIRAGYMKEKLSLTYYACDVRRRCGGRGLRSRRIGVRPEHRR